MTTKNIFMSQKKQNKNLLLTKEGVLFAKACSIVIDAFLSIVRGDSTCKFLLDFNGIELPDWGSDYLMTDEKRRLVDAVLKEVQVRSKSSTIDDGINLPKIDIEIMQELVKKLGCMSSELQERGISWGELVGSLRDCLNFSGGTVEKDFLDIYIKVRAIIVSIASRVGYRKSLDMLYAEAMNGDDDAFLKMVTLDKAIITTEWACWRVRKATLNGEVSFFDKLGTALNKKPFTKKKQLRLATFILFFSEFGFKELNYLERVEFLEAIGFKEKEIPEQDALRQLIYRL